MASASEENLRAGMEELAARVKDAEKSLEQKGANDKLQEALNRAEGIRQRLERLQNQGAGERGNGEEAANRGGPQGRNQSREGEGTGQAPGSRQNGQEGQGRQAGNQQGQPSEQGQAGQPGRQGGQGGQPGQSGQPGEEGSMAAGSPAGTQGGASSSVSGGGNFSGRPFAPGSNSAPFTPEEARAWSEQLHALGRQAAGLLPLLSDEPALGKLARDLVAAMENTPGGGFGSRPGDNLGQNLIDRWKEMEMLLGRRLQGDKTDPVRIAGQEPVPEKYRAIVEEYYRSLSRSQR